MTKKNTSALAKADFWTWVGTIGGFISFIFYTSEWLARSLEIMLTTTGYAPEKLPSLGKLKKIGDVSAMAYLIGFTFALFLTIGFCYIMFFYLLQNQDPSRESLSKKIDHIDDKKTFENQENKKILTIQHDSYTWRQFSAGEKIAFISSVITVSSWIGAAALTIFLLPIHLSSKSQLIIIISLFMLGCIASIPSARYYYAVVQQTNMNNPPEPKPTFIENTLYLVIFSVVLFFCNTYFLSNTANSLSFFSNSNSHSLLGITLFSWVLGSLISLFFTLSSLYSYYLINTRGIHKSNKHYQIKAWQIPILAGYFGITILDYFFPISIALTCTLQNSHQNKNIFYLLYTTSLLFSVFCAIGPLRVGCNALTNDNMAKSNNLLAE